MSHASCLHTLHIYELACMLLTSMNITGVNEMQWTVVMSTTPYLGCLAAFPTYLSQSKGLRFLTQILVCGGKRTTKQIVSTLLFSSVVGVVIDAGDDVLSTIVAAVDGEGRSHLTPL